MFSLGLSQVHVRLRREDMPITADNDIDDRSMARRSTDRRRPDRSRRRVKPAQADGPPVTCTKEVALISDYLSGSLGPPVLDAFEEHLKVCSDCAAFLHTYKKTIEVTRAFLRLQCEKQRPSRAALRPLND